MHFKKATISEIALKLNITTSTVSRALNDNPRISKLTTLRVKEMAKVLNYEPNELAAALRSGKSKVIGIIVPNINRILFSSVISSAEEVANSFGYKVLISQTYESFENEVQTIDAFLGARVAGIIASVAKNSNQFSHFQKVIDSRVPLVLFDRTNPLIQTSQVVLDDYFAAYSITQHLIQQGCNRIAYFTRNNNLTIYQDRLNGYLDALNHHKIAIDESLILKSNLQLEDGRSCMKQLLLLNPIPDAVFSASDYAIVGAMQVVKEHKLSIPNDIALAGFGNEPFTSFTEPAITTVDHMCFEMGTKAANLIFDMLNNEGRKFVSQKIVLEPGIIFRASTQKIKS